MVLPYALKPPFQTHPPLPCELPLKEMGCVGCHRGQAWGVTVEEAHGLAKGSVEKLLDSKAGNMRQQALQPGCVQCHITLKDGRLVLDAQIVPDLAKGQSLYISEGCTSCHELRGIEAHREIGPRLSQIGLKRSSAEILQSLKKPQQNNPDSPMPPLLLPEPEVQRLVLFLVSQRGARNEASRSLLNQIQTVSQRPQLLEHFEDELPDVASSARGAFWARKLGCKGCHRLGEDDVGVPDLNHVGWYATEAELRDTLENPALLIPGTFMPSYEIPRVLKESLVLYLATQRVPLPSSPVLLLHEVCGRCHGEPADPKKVVLVKRPPLIVRENCSLSRAQFDRALSSTKRPSAMPPWKRIFSERFISELYQSLCSCRGNHAK
jgi:cytochrome c551/c552